MRPLPTPDPTWDSTLSELVRRKARLLVGLAGLRSQDVPDLEQELAADLVVRLRAFDPAKADRDRFVRMVVYRAAAKLLRHRRAGKRASAAVEALGIDPSARPGEPADRRLDVAEALARDRPAAAARRLGVPRATLYARMDEVRTHFAARGLGVYGPAVQTLPA